MKMTKAKNDAWEKKWREKLQALPQVLESIEQVNIIMSSTIDRYEGLNMLADVLLWQHVQSSMNRIWSAKTRSV